MMNGVDSSLRDDFGAELKASAFEVHSLEIVSAKNFETARFVLEPDSVENANGQIQQMNSGTMRKSLGRRLSLCSESNHDVSFTGSQRF